MNGYARAIIGIIQSQQNQKYLYARLLNEFDSARVRQYLNDHIAANISNFAYRIEQELYFSEPFPGTTVRDQVTCFNERFISDHVDFIRSQILREERAPVYILRDGAPTSGLDDSHHAQAPDDILASWKANNARPICLRQDITQNIVPSSGQYSGITVCDQNHLGLQNHERQYDTAIKRNLNATQYPHENTPFGVSTPAADARLLERKIFRANSANVVNGIPIHETSIYRRNHDKDISETLRDAEKGCILYSQDTSSLRRRLEHKKTIQSQYCHKSNSQ